MVRFGNFYVFKIFRERTVITMGFFEGIAELLTTSEYMGSIFEGLKTTFIISFFAAILGLILGVCVAMVTIAIKSF